MRLSIIISERGEPHNLVWTLQGLEQEFANAPFDYEYVIVVNGPEGEDPTSRDNEAHAHHTYLWLQKKWPWLGGKARFAYNSPGGIYQARNLGAELATGDLFWFLDAHTMPVPGAYLAAMEFKKEFRGVLHLGLRYFLDKPGRTVYGYRWKRDMFWGSWTRTPPVPPKYYILMNGGACILIDRDIWFEIGGYNKGLGIYGGGEPYTDIKTWMYGYEVKSHPEMQYYHLAIKRGYAWNQTDMWKNFMITSMACGGQKYFDLVYASYCKKCEGHPAWQATLDKAKDLAMEFALPDWEHTKATAKYSVDEVLDRWRAYALEHGHEIDDWPR